MTNITRKLMRQKKDWLVAELLNATREIERLQKIIEYMERKESNDTKMD